MHNLMHVYLLFCCVSLIQKSCQGGIRGIDVKNEDKYKPTDGGKFKCINSTQLISYKSLNDDYCDCEDGTDEPGTSACAKSKFYCVNKGFKPKYIFSSRVNDGICDCCDGSDEYSGRIKCENNCVQLNKIEAALNDERLTELKKGLKLKNDYAHRAKDWKLSKSQEAENLKSEIDVLKRQTDQLSERKTFLEKKRDEAKEKLKKKEEKVPAVCQFLNMKPEVIDQDIFVNAIERLKSIIENFLSDAIEDDNSVESKVAKASKEYEAYLEEFSIVEGNTESVEEIVDGTVPDDSHIEEEDLIIDESEQDEDKSDSWLANILPNCFMSRIEIIKNKIPFPSWMNKENEKIEDVNMNSLKSVRNAYNQKKNTLDRQKEELSKLEKILKNDYGASNEYSALIGECISFSKDDYKYEICPFGEAFQQQNSNAQKISLGKFDSWNIGSKVMQFKHGLSCWNGPQRQITVQLECGQANTIVKVDEPSMCEYTAILKTPFACDEPETKRHNEL